MVETMQIKSDIEHVYSALQEAKEGTVLEMNDGSTFIKKNGLTVNYKGNTILKLKIVPAQYGKVEPEDAEYINPNFVCGYGNCIHERIKGLACNEERVYWESKNGFTFNLETRMADGIIFQQVWMNELRFKSFKEKLTNKLLNNKKIKLDEQLRMSIYSGVYLDEPYEKLLLLPDFYHEWLDRAEYPSARRKEIEDYLVDKIEDWKQYQEFKWSFVKEKSRFFFNPIEELDFNQIKLLEKSFCIIQNYLKTADQREQRKWCLEAIKQAQNDDVIDVEEVLKRAVTLQLTN